MKIILQKESLELLGWRQVPVDPETLGSKARDCMPCIMQAFVKKPKRVAKGLEFDRKLYVVRLVFEQSNDNTYICSMSSRTIVYKEMFLVGQPRRFFLDLQDQDYESAIAVVHSRFSTNTNPSRDSTRLPCPMYLLPGICIGASPWWSGLSGRAGRPQGQWMNP